MRCTLAVATQYGWWAATSAASIVSSSSSPAPVRRFRPQPQPGRCARPPWATAPRARRAGGRWRATAYGRCGRAGSARTGWPPSPAGCRGGAVRQRGAGTARSPGAACGPTGGCPAGSTARRRFRRRSAPVGGFGKIAAGPAGPRLLHWPAADAPPGGPERASPKPDGALSRRRRRARRRACPGCRRRRCRRARPTGDRVAHALRVSRSAGAH